MKYSIRIRLVIIMTVTIGCILLLFWVTNKTFLPKFYETYKVGMLGKAYNTVCGIYKDNLNHKEKEDPDILNNEINLALESLGANQSLNLYIFRMYDSQAGRYFKYLYPSMDILRENQVFDLIREHFFNENNIETSQLLEENAKYKIYKVFDKRVGSNYLELIGAADENTGVYIRSNYQSMMESVEISSRFLALIGIGITFIGIIIMYMISKSFTKPILELSDIATKMSHLNFDIHYHVNRKDEIGTLGDSINTLSQKLEGTISELKAANNQLKKDIEQKDKMEKMRTEFLSNVSHELKTPIALIQGYAEGLSENINEDEENRKFYCDVIVDEAAKMNKMVKKLLSLNQIEFGEESIAFQRFDLAALIISILESTDILFRQKEVSLQFENKEPIYVWADAYLVEEVFTNYLSNALNHVSGPKQIEIKILPCKDLVRVTVFNTGDNIPEGELERIWDKFYKVDKARTREYGGSGIGLSIVRAIMDSFNQRYGVANHPTGVEFWFELDCSL